MKALIFFIFCLFFINDTEIRAVQTGGGYTVQDRVNNIVGNVSGNGINTKTGGTAISQNVFGGGVNAYVGANTYIVPPIIPVIPTQTSGGGGGGGGGGSSSFSSSTILSIKNINNNSTTTISCIDEIVLEKPISFRSIFHINKKSDIITTQKFLNTYEGANLSVDGVYKKVDFDAVVKWQEKYSDAILKPWGIKKGNGYIYKTSMKQMKIQQAQVCKNINLNTKDNIKTLKPLKISCPYFTQYANIKSRGNEVKKIQEFLNSEVDAGMIVNGIYDFETKFAVSLFQKKYSKETLSFWRLGIPSGLWHKTTLKKANEILGCY